MTLRIDHQRLRTLRLAAGISTNALARRLGITRQFINTLESHSDHSALSLAVLNRLGIALGIDPLTLLTTEPGIDGDFTTPQRPDRPLDDGTLRQLHDAIRGTLLPAAGTNHVVHLRHIRSIGLLHVTTTPGKSSTYTVDASIWHALNRQPPTAPQTLHRPASKEATWRRDLLDAIERLELAGHRTFSATQIAREATRAGSTYATTTLRLHAHHDLTHPTPEPALHRYNDLRRIGRGRYERAQPATAMRPEADRRPRCNDCT